MVAPKYEPPRRTDGEPTTQEAIQQAVDGLKARGFQVYVWGSVKCRDAFNRRRRTLFRDVYTPDDPLMFRSCDRYNDAD